MNDKETLPLASATREGALILQRSGVAEARREAVSLLAHALRRDLTFLLTHPEHTLTSTDASRFRAMIERRAAGEPLQYITGRQEFYGLEFEVTPDVLIPRPETELLVEKALELLKESDEPPRICDVGTGSGCIAVTLLHESKHPVARMMGLDISPAALEVAARNAARHDVRERLDLVASDCFAALAGGRARFSMIVSNPPYIDEDAIADLQREVRFFEPRGALTPGADGLSLIRRLLTDAPSFLFPGGHLLLEIGFDQHSAVRELIDGRVWRLLDIYGDLQGIPRIVALRKN
ncbi:MAG TPA: peptide chain release factor N(5)-glutamine methyltransferase [Pyrinomonadaceae bacterium]|jgi:release factor glutamine methyltransferase